MKQISEITCHHIVSEPGDATRYDYLTVKDGDIYRFWPFNNSFAYPEYIPEWEKDNEKTVSYLADKFNCNPWTVKECLRTVKEFESK